MFKSEEQARIEELARLYVQAKSLIIYSEEADPDSRSNIQIIKELRDAFDHFMRVVVARTDPNSPHSQEDGYGDKNLHKAIGHVYRATFDALDGTVVSLKEKIVELLDPYPREVINDVVKDYWKMRVKLDELTQRIASHRASKDVGENAGKVLDAYAEDVDVLRAFYKRLLNSMDALEDSRRRHRRSEWKMWGIRILIGVILLIVGWWLRGFS